MRIFFCFSLFLFIFFFFLIVDRGIKNLKMIKVQMERIYENFQKFQEHSLRLKATNITFTVVIVNHKNNRENNSILILLLYLLLLLSSMWNKAYTTWKLNQHKRYKNEIKKCIELP